MGLHLEEYQKPSATYRFQKTVYDHLKPNGIDFRPTSWLASVAGINIGTAIEITRKSKCLETIGTGKSHDATDVARLFAPSSESCRSCEFIQSKNRMGCVMYDKDVSASTAMQGYKAFRSQEGEVPQEEEH